MKPKGRKGRNLYERGGVIYYQRRVGGRRIRFSTQTADWDEAAAVRDLFEARKRIGSAFPIVESARFDEIVERYLRSARGHLAPSTLEDRRSLLREDGEIRAHFGKLRLDQVTRRALNAWWETEIEGRGRAHNTGLNHLSAISAVLGYAIDCELLEENPVDGFRATLRRRRRTKRGRADVERRETRNPLDLADLRAFLAASEAAGGARFGNGRPVRQRAAGHVADLLMLDAGLREGEVAALRWEHVRWGDGPSDTRRSLEIRESRARGRHEGPPKSGRSRTVALSRRLRTVLRDYWLAQGQPAASERILASFNPQNYAARHFAEVCKAAGLEGHSPKDLRDTFASQLLSAGIPLAYISKQLGHASQGVTETHYAKWIPAGDEYRAPEPLEPGEVPADLLARVGVKPAAREATA